MALDEDGAALNVAAATWVEQRRFEGESVWVPLRTTTRSGLRSAATRPEYLVAGLVALVLVGVWSWRRWGDPRQRAG